MAGTAQSEGNKDDAGGGDGGSEGVLTDMRGEAWDELRKHKRPRREDGADETLV